MKYYIIAGEASGDMHGGNLMRAILKKDQGAKFRFWGGDKMAKVGGKPVKHIRELAFMGFFEVLANIRTILGNIKYCKQDLLNDQPDVLVLIDYPGFNLRIADFAHKNGIRVVYYISPQVWAWKQSRVKKIKKVVDEMLVILPFEKEFYQKWGMDVQFVGHPLLDAIDQYQAENTDTFIKDNDLENKKIIAILPGSRKQEIAVQLPIMLKAAEHHKDLQPVVAAAPATDKKLYKNVDEQIPVVQNQTYELLSHAHAALVTSGTATLETALFNVPQVVCYKGGWISYQIAKRLVKVDYIALVNLILQKEAVKELIQNELTEKAISKELNQICGDKRTEIMEDYKALRKLLGKGGASEIVANTLLKNTPQASSNQGSQP